MPAPILKQDSAMHLSVHTESGEDTKRMRIVVVKRVMVDVLAWCMDKHADTEL
jgi:hypothetical protein